MLIGPIRLIGLIWRSGRMFYCYRNDHERLKKARLILHRPLLWRIMDFYMAGKQRP